MAGLIRKLMLLLGNPKARAAVDQARRQAADPRNRQRLAGLLGRLGKRR